MAGSAVLDLENLWDESLSDVTRNVTSPAQRRWLHDTHPVGFNDDTVVLAAPHTFAREWLDSRCGDDLRAALSKAAGRSLQVVITVQPNPAPVDHDVHDTAKAAADSAGGGDATPVPTGHEPTDEEGRAVRPEPGREAGPEAGPEQDPERSPEQHPEQSAAGQEQDQGADRGAPRPSPVPSELAPSHPGPAASAADERYPGLDPIAERSPTNPPSDGARLATTEERPLEAPGRPPGPTVHVPAPEPSRASPDDTQLNPKYVFDRFVIGASNRFAHAAAFAVAEAPARAYNPLFIYGGAGLGKTHLLHAIGHYVRSLYPRLQVRYVTTEQFTNDFINAIREHRNTAFQRTYRQTDVLLIDDIQFLERAERTQEEFFHTFNALHNAEKQIVISSDRPPKQIARLEDRLRSRFEWGLMTDVQPPDLETRIAILKKKTTYESLSVPTDVLELIASKVESNIRELEGALIRVTAYASLQQADVDRELAEVVLKDLFPNESPREISPSLIQEVVAEFFDLTVEELCSPSRTRQLVTARQIAMFLVRELTDLSLPRIGKAFGGRDHTTVMHARDKISGLMQERQTIYDQVQELTTLIRNRARQS